MYTSIQPVQWLCHNSYERKYTSGNILPNITLLYRGLELLGVVVSFHLFSHTSWSSRNRICWFRFATLLCFARALNRLVWGTCFFGNGGWLRCFVPYLFQFGYDAYWLLLFVTSLIVRVIMSEVSTKDFRLSNLLWVPYRGHDSLSVLPVWVQKHLEFWVALLLLNLSSLSEVIV